MNCKYCSKKLPPQTGRGRPRKFCDDVCRRRYHEVRPCEQCGTLTWAKLCAKCTRENRILLKQQEVAFLWNTILDLRAEGLLNHEVARRVKKSQLSVQSTLHRMRIAGLPVTDSTYDYHAYMDQYIQRKRAVRRIKSL